MDKLSMNSIGVWVMWKLEFCKSSSAWRDRNRVYSCLCSFDASTNHVSKIRRILDAFHWNGASGIGGV